MADKDVVIPDLGGAESVDVIELCVKVGDSFSQEDSLIVVESDKATIEIPAPFDGEVAKLSIAVGDSVKEGDLLLVAMTKDAVNATEATQAAEQVDVVTAPVEEVAVVAVSPETVTTTTKTIVVPDIGGSDDVEVIEISVAVGDTLAVEDTMVVLESDKATMEIPCSDAGVVKEILLSVGDKLSEGSVVLTLEVSAKVPAQQVVAPSSADVAPEVAAQTQKQDVAAKSKPVAPEASSPSKQVHAGPAVRRLARELGVDLALVSATGPKKRILKDDVHGFVKQAMTDKSQAAAPSTGLPPLPVIDFAKFGDIDSQPLSRINKVSAANLHRSWVNVPHVTQFDEADVSELETFRKSESAAYKEQGIKLTLLAFMVKACAKALQAFPRFNSSLSQDGETLIFKQYVNIGIAVDTPNGLVVPVIRDADKKTVLDIAQDMQMLSAKARDKKLSPNDMQGGCFSISSLGGIGGTAFTPIVNWPEVAILGLSRSQMKPVYQEGEFVPRLMLPMSLSYDHRVIDGADAARFTRYLSDQITDIRRLLL
ncbi:dihydrolipoyllysine-residue acetyltransferase [Gammaproteobacteria bacterium 45_16_T64]|nr:dihydrolipoyllysine-residue acetyltransferase [Gammaproteobacteria bacterium 45_16_T64]